MTDANEARAIKLPFGTGEHLVTWQVPDRSGAEVEIPGLLTVEQGKYPNGILYGDMPIERHGGMAAFPQRHPFDTLTGRLSSGAFVALMNGQVNYWVTSQGRAVWRHHRRRAGAGPPVREVATGRRGYVRRRGCVRTH